MKVISVYVSELEQQICLVNNKVIGVVDCNDANLTRDDYLNPVLRNVGVEIEIVNQLTATQIKQALKLGASFGDGEIR